MKLYPAYKKQFNILFALFFGTLLMIPIVFSHAQTETELKNKINQKNSEIDKLEKEIAAYQGQLNTLGQQKSSLAGSIKQLDITRKKLIADISVTQNKIDKTNYKIEELTSNIGEKQDSISNNMDAISSDIRDVNEFEIATFAEKILSQDDFTMVWNDVDNMATIREEILKRIGLLKQAKGDLEDTRTETISAKNELLRLKSQLADEKKIVDQNTADKKKLLAQTQNSEANYQKLLASQVEKKLALEKDLRDYESQLQFILDPSKLPTKGVLSWPLDSVFVTQLFGKTVAAQRLYTSGSHSGMDFRASVGTPVKSMANGVVEGTGNTDTTCPGASFGKWVFIVYDNGLSSTFGHLSLIKVEKGQKVLRGEVVAYSGSTGHVTGPHLHVSLYAPNAATVQTLPSKSCTGKTLTQPLAAINAYLDPMYYLPPYKP